MTSEILIMNNNAIVMAADSAVTVDNKTYNGANKLFKLSNNPPMGIMISGSAEFGSIPLETLIKEYREKTDFEELGNVMKIKESFIEYLRKIPYDNDFSNLDNELETFRNVLLGWIKNTSKEKIVKSINSSANMEIFPFLEENYMENRFEELSKELSEKGIEVDSNILKKYFSEIFALSSTGVVIAGFNKNDYFPSYVSFNLIGKQKGKVIIHDINSEINYSNSLIVPFAQKDVIASFISGIDSNLEEGIINYFYNFLELYSKELPDENSIINKKNEDESKMNEFKENIELLKKRIYSPILESIGTLPKEELANMAESMIYITSLRRKISSELETVGGDIDVAIISKGDGFIWRKRKCYYKSELNPHVLIKSME